MGKIDLQLIVAAHQVVVNVPIKVTAETAHFTLQTTAIILIHMLKLTFTRIKRISMMYVYRDPQLCKTHTLFVRPLSLGLRFTEEEVLLVNNVMNRENPYPVLGRDVDPEVGALVPADGDVFTQEKDVKLTRTYDLHL